MNLKNRFIKYHTTTLFLLFSFLFPMNILAQVNQENTVKKVYVIDYYDKTTHRIKKDDLKECDDVLLKVDGVERICFYMYSPDSFGNTYFDPNCDFHFSDRQKRWLNAGVRSGRSLYLVITEAWNASGENIGLRLPPIELTFK